MTIKSKQLIDLSPELINKNPENPRIIFREEDFDALLRSIKEVGIQVPLSVYKNGNKYVLIDGERRWRCSLRLRLKEIPAIIEPKPTPLENLLMMFNIHNVRVQWDLIAIAYKIERIRDLFQKEQGVSLTKKAIADLTGLSTATIARCDELLSLPEKYKKLIWKELEKPRGDQKYTADLFIEIKRNIKTIESYVPEITKEKSSDKLLDIFFEKYKSEIVNNVVHYRDLSKIARGELVGVPKEKIIDTLQKFIRDPSYSIKNAFEDSVGDAYSERTFESKILTVLSLIKNIDVKEIKGKVKEALFELQSELNRILKGR